MSNVNIAVFVLALLVLAGCGKGGCTYSSSSSNSWNVNGRSHKTITVSRDGVTRRVETTADVEFANGQVTKFPLGALIQLTETGGAEAREAELRENAGKLELWVKDKDGFHRGSASEEAWLQRFLREIIKK